MSKNLEALQRELAIAYSDFFRAIEQLRPDKRCQPGVSGDWSPKDVVSHLIGWDKSLQEFIANPDAFNPEPLYDITLFNANSVSVRQHQSWEETIDELKNSYMHLEKATSTVTAEMKIYGRVSKWLNARKEDYEFHTSQIEAWID